MTVPEGHLLVRRVNPDTDEFKTYEAFLITPVANVEGTVTRVFLSWNPLRIRKRVRESNSNRVCAGA